MSEQLIKILKRKLDDLAAFGGVDAETRRNVLKEELQFYILNFIYHHPEYSAWIMYGGSALRIMHGLDRMSVDLDFEVARTITEKYLTKLKKDVEKHFTDTYNAGPDFITAKIVTGRGLLLKFHVSEELSGHHSRQVHVKIDLNHFVSPETAIERNPINRDQLSFVIVTYNMSSLMASKLAAIFLRGTRGVGKESYEEKGRDIYDLLWYMGRKITPDLGYLIAKGIAVKDFRELFDKLTIKMNKVSDKNLKQDLLPLFVNRTYIENWLKNWRESYLRLLDEYRISTITGLEYVGIHQDFDTDNYSFSFRYKTEDDKSVKVVYTISAYWISNQEGKLPIETDNGLDNKIEFTASLVGLTSKKRARLKQYATLFYRKTEEYLNKTNRTILGISISSKVIRMTASNLNQKEQVVLSKSALISCGLDDLLK
jgi:hypothetical protein